MNWNVSMKGKEWITLRITVTRVLKYTSQTYDFKWNRTGKKKKTFRSTWLCAVRKKLTWWNCRGHVSLASQNPAASSESSDQWGPMTRLTTGELIELSPISCQNWLEVCPVKQVSPYRTEGTLGPARAWNNRFNVQFTHAVILMPTINKGWIKFVQGHNPSLRPAPRKLWWRV